MTDIVTCGVQILIAIADSRSEAPLVLEVPRPQPSPQLCYPVCDQPGIEPGTSAQIRASQAPLNHLILTVTPKPDVSIVILPALAAFGQSYGKRAARREVAVATGAGGDQMGTTTVCKWLSVISYQISVKAALRALLPSTPSFVAHTLSTLIANSKLLLFDLSVVL